MPFSRSLSLIKNVVSDITKKTSCSLQVSRQRIVKKNNLFIDYKKLKRVFSFTSQKGFPWIKAVKKAGISLEAAIVTSIFMFAVLSIIGFLCVLNLQNNIQMTLENIARTMSQNIYYVEELKETTRNSTIFKEVNDMLTKNNTDTLDEETVEKLEKASFDMYIYGKFISEMGTEYINESYIVGGILGLNFSKSIYDEEDGIIDIVLDYVIKVPFLPENIGMISDRKRVYVKAWNGMDIMQESDLVYITMNGAVYHSDKDCPHINIDVIKITYEQLKNQRNDSGAGYGRCKYCGNKNCTDTSVVYITKYGACYHTTLSCGGISRSVITIDKSQIGDRALCKDCEKRMGGK